MDAKTKTVNTHLRPGYMAAFQNNSDHKHNSTQAMLEEAPLSMIINRDASGYAEGKLFLDDGYSLAQLDSEQYEYYSFQLGGNTIKKWNLNDKALASNGKGLDAFVITDAADLKDVDFACMTNKEDRTLQGVNTAYDSAKKTLTITMEQGFIPVFEMRDIHFGVGQKDLNLCDPSVHFYMLADAKTPVDLKTNTATIELASQTPDAARNLKLQLSLYESGVIGVNWTYADANGVKTPFQVPTEIVDFPRTLRNKADTLDTYVTITQAPNAAVAMSIKNKAGQVIWTLNGMVLSEYMNFISAKVNTDKDFKTGILGLTERVSSDLYLADGVYSLWALDTADPVEDGKAPGNNMYGTHPFYMAKAPKADMLSTGWFGVFSNVANAQDWWIKNDLDTGAVNIDTIATGGLGDMYFMMGDTPDAVTKLYHTIIGKPVTIPQWALGWNQCRWGYNSTQDLKEVVAGYHGAGIPLDTQWSDIDYLKDYRDFTFDSDGSYSGLKEFVDELHSKHMHYIPILDAGLAQRAGYDAYEEGKKAGIFVKAPNGVDDFTGQVWPTDAAFPDWFHPDTSAHWSKWLTEMHEKLPFDGLWEDMNEASNFCTGECYRSQRAEYPV